MYIGADFFLAAERSNADRDSEWAFHCVRAPPGI
jgi:hypothetical protein